MTQITLTRAGIEKKNEENVYVHERTTRNKRLQRADDGNRMHFIVVTMEAGACTDVDRPPLEFAPRRPQAPSRSVYFFLFGLLLSK